MTWKELVVQQSAFSLRKTLRSGQVFRWVAVEEREGAFVGVLGRRVVELSQDGDAEARGLIRYRERVAARGVKRPLEAHLKDYFNVSTEIKALVEPWLKSKSSSLLVTHFQAAFKANTGSGMLTVLRQDPEECLLSFICSQNNNVKRISKMIEAICVSFGEKLGECEGRDWYAFPTAERLRSVDNLQAALQEMGFGYRARYVEATVKELEERPVARLRGLPYEEAVEALTGFTGVGRKVADCVALFSLDQHSAVPVDTHVLRIARTALSLPSRSLTANAYRVIHDAFLSDFGPYSGWAQALLFHLELTNDEHSIRSIGADRSINEKKEAAKRVRDPKSEGTFGDPGLEENVPQATASVRKKKKSTQKPRVA